MMQWFATDYHWLVLLGIPYVGIAIFWIGDKKGWW